MQVRFAGATHASDHVLTPSLSKTDAWLCDCCVRAAWFMFDPSRRCVRLIDAYAIGALHTVGGPTRLAPSRWPGRRGDDLTASFAVLQAFCRA